VKYKDLFVLLAPGASMEKKMTESLSGASTVSGKTTIEPEDAKMFNHSLEAITKGTGILVVGTFLGLLFSFASRILIAKFWTLTDYGIFSLALVILSFSAVISSLGLQTGLSRIIAYEIGKKNTKKIAQIISYSLRLSLFTSLIVAAILFLSSGFISNFFFNEPSLIRPLRIFSIAIPFFTLIYIYTSIFRGFGQVKPKFYFQDLLRSILFLAMLAVVIIIDLDYIYIFWAYTLSMAVIAISLFFYHKSHLPVIATPRTKSSGSMIVKEILIFSLPLLGVSILQLIVGWSDTLMLGGLKTSAEVGLYNVVHTLASFIASPLHSMLLIFIPVMSGLYAKEALGKMKRDFTILTKWLFFATLPLFLVIFLYPRIVINFLFGADYVPATTTLQILSLGFMITNLMGPNGATLIAMGKSRFIMWTTLATALLNILLNGVLIPRYGIEGAAIASITSLTSINIIRCWKLFTISTIHPLSNNLLKPAILSGLLISIMYFFVSTFLTITFWALPLIFVIIIIISVFSVILTKSLDDDDIKAITYVENKTGINLKIIRKLIQKLL